VNNIYVRLYRHENSIGVKVEDGKFAVAPTERREVGYPNFPYYLGGFGLGSEGYPVEFYGSNFARGILFRKQ